MFRDMGNTIDDVQNPLNWGSTKADCLSAGEAETGNAGEQPVKE